MEFEKQKIIEQLSFMAQCNMDFSDKEEAPFDKNEKKSTEVRKKGNQLFVKKDHNAESHEEVWKLYTKSIAYAESGSEELAFGYANRSAFLLHLMKYKECLLDIERALKVTQSSALKVKLFCRQTECFMALKDGKYVNSLEKAKYWLNKIHDDAETKKLNDMIDKAENSMRSIYAIPRGPKEKKSDISCENDAVDIKYDEKYGRHLVAARNIQPAEFVYLEKYHATSISQSKLYAYCSHCLKVSWALIPCDQCSHFMYCSEECKTEAWTKYHDIECFVKFAGTSEPNIFQHYSQLALRSLIMGFKEFGSIKKLQDLVSELKECTDNRKKGFSRNGKFCSDSIRSLLSLSYTKDSKLVNYFSVLAAGLLINLAKKTTFLGEKINVVNAKQLMKNQDALFVGSVLLRLLCIFRINAFAVINTNAEKCKHSKNDISCITDSCCIRGTNISLVTSLINHSCDNNVDKVYTNDGKVAYFALKPIPKGSQIFSSYYNGDYLLCPVGRNHVFNGFFEFDCDCLACQEDWPAYGTIMAEDTYFDNPFNYNKLAKKLMEKSKKLMDSFANDEETTSKKTIRDYAKMHVEVLKALKTTTPLSVTTTFRFTLSLMMEKRYYEILKVPDSCLPF